MNYAHGSLSELAKQDAADLNSVTAQRTKLRAAHGIRELSKPKSDGSKS